MIDEWRTLLYPLGFLSSLAFAGRFIIQWLQSEKAEKTIVPQSFWQLSLIGNCLLMFHSFIQMQYHICLVQSWNAIISWRNLNLMQTRTPPASLKKVWLLLLGSSFFVSLAFAAQDGWLVNSEHWFRIPTAPWQASAVNSLPLFWHALGAIAYLLFSSRFWIQWWCTERAGSSQLPSSFWWLSLIGALFSIAYFMRISDSVNLIGPLVGVIPYLRNLMLIRKQETA